MVDLDRLSYWVLDCISGLIMLMLLGVRLFFKILVMVVFIFGYCFVIWCNLLVLFWLMSWIVLKVFIRFVVSWNVFGLNIFLGLMMVI